VSGLGRRTPPDFAHVDKYPARAVLRPVDHVERTLRLPQWHWTWDQGSEGACVGYGSSMMMSLLNARRYDPRWLWDQAKLIDDWPETNPGDNNGTSVRAACDVLRTQGHVRVLAGKPRPVSSADGIAANRWATTVDEIRASIAAGVPVAIGVDWLQNFDRPVSEGRDWWIGRAGWESTPVRGGHCVCLYGASDRRQALRVKNSWGRGYPLVWLPYEAMERLLARDGEACLVSDR
jgi:hypothetical protein